MDEYDANGCALVRLYIRYGIIDANNIPEDLRLRMIKPKPAAIFKLSTDPAVTRRGADKLNRLMGRDR